MRKLAVVMLFGVLVSGSRNAAAQGAPDDRVYLNIGFGVESGSFDSNDSREYTLYDEPATTNVDTPWTSGSFFGGGVDFRIYKNLTVGAAYHQETNTSEARVYGTAPHPIFFNRPRTFDQEVSGLFRRERATHLSVGWIVPIGAKLDVLVSGGPSFYRFAQEIISDVTIREGAAPFNQPVLQLNQTDQERDEMGYNVGADVTYIFWQNDRLRLGAGGFFRYTEANAEVRLIDSDRETKVGGAQFGFGGRIRF